MVLALRTLLTPAFSRHTEPKFNSIATRRLVVIGTGAALLLPEPQILIYADLPRWEIQKRQRSGQIAEILPRGTSKTLLFSKIQAGLLPGLARRRSHQARALEPSSTICRYDQSRQSPP